MNHEKQLPRRNLLTAAGIAGAGVWAGGTISIGGIPSVIDAHADEQAAAGPASSGEGVTRRLAEFVVNSRSAQIPPAARREAIRSVVNYVGCAVGGSAHLTVTCALEALAPFSGTPQASVIGRRDRLDLLHAALINGISSHVLDYDDTQLSTIIHPAGPVASVLFPLAEQRRISGEEFLHALILGVDVECRIGKTVYPSHYDAGWHITGTAGVFGAAAAAGKVLGLDARRMTWALGIAATQSAGFREMFGTMCKAFHPGRAAQNGLTAALLAAKGFTSSEQSIESRLGFAHVMSRERDFSAITRGLGTDFEIVENTYKPFACGVVIHPVIDACIQLRAQHALTDAMIERIDLRVHPLVLELTGKTEPQSGLEGKFSVYHAAAAAILRGSAGPREFTDDVVRDPQLVSLRRRVHTTVDPSLKEEQAHVTVRVQRGMQFEKLIESAIGSRNNPLSDSDLTRKVKGLTEGALTTQQSDQLIRLCWSLESLVDAGEIPRAAAIRP